LNPTCTRQLIFLLRKRSCLWLYTAFTCMRVYGSLVHYTIAQWWSVGE